MTPKYLYELADLADPDQLWRLSGIDKMNLSVEDKQKLDTGVALRRHASHIQQLIDLVGTGDCLVITPLGPNSKAIKTMPAPEDHRVLLNRRG